MVNFVKSTQVLAVNGYDVSVVDFIGGTVTGLTRDVPCAPTNIAGAFWRIPIVQGGIIIRQEYQVATNSTKATPDSVKILRVKNINDVIDIAIADTDYVTINDEFASLCDGLGGSLAVMPTVTIPFPIIQDPPTSTNPNNVFTFPFPLNPLGLTYNIPWPWFNGVAAYAAYAPSGITTAALFVTWANANWGNYGTWASSGNIVTLTSPSSAATPVFKAGLNISLAAALYCLDLTSFGTAQPINGMSLNGGAIIPFGAFTATETSYQQVINAMTPHFESGAVFTQTVTNKITISTVSGVVKLYDGVTVEATSTAGTC